MRAKSSDVKFEKLETGSTLYWEVTRGSSLG